METNEPQLPKGFFSGPMALGITLLILLLLRVIISFLPVPVAWVAPLSIAVSALFLGLPIIGLFFSANYRWTWKQALAMVGIGVALQVLFSLVRVPGAPGVLFMALAQTGLLTWCAGLGALIATLIRDRNIIVPVALFLAGFDIFLVTFPYSTTRKILDANPKVFQGVAYALPKVSQTVNTATVPVSAYVGPADFFFLFTFFVCLFKFGLRQRATLVWTVVALILYMLVVLLFGDLSIGPISLASLPALLPIGGVFLLVNWKEFKMKADERIATLVVALIAIGIATAGITAAAKKSSAPPAPVSNKP